LKNFLSLRINYVTTETLKVLQDVFRKYPSYIENFVPYFNRTCLEQLTESIGKSAFVWIIGSFGEQLEDAPYMLEKIIEEEQDNSYSEIWKFLVIACTKLFFKRAPEMHHILANLYSIILK